MLQQRPVPGSVPGSSGPYLTKRPHLEAGNEACPSDKKSACGSVSTSSTNTRRKGVYGGSVLLICHSPQASHHLHLQFFRSVCFSNFFDQWRSITSNGFVFNMVWGDHLHLWSHPPLFHNFCSLMSMWLPLIILLFRSRWMSFLLREQLNAFLVVLVSLLSCLWFLSILWSPAHT